MNIESLQDHINAFTREVVDSGFKRDLDDYASSLPASQNNIVALREIAGKVLPVLDRLYNGDLPTSLRSLLSRRKIQPFTEVPNDSNLRKLTENTQIQQQEFFNQLNQFINQLRNQIQQNANEIAKIKDFIAPYISADTERITAKGLATIAIVFNDGRIITNLEQFTKALAAWNRVLPIYHQLLKSESPKDIQIVEIQNGSIEVVVNLDVNVALDLVELFKLGFEVFAAYLSYKKMIKPIIDSYHGNEKLISQEEEREKLLLENIGTALHKRINGQHTKAKKVDKRVDGTAVPKKVEQVTNLITSHIVRGNDIKLLALPKTEKLKEGERNLPDERDALRELSMIARRELRLLPVEAQPKLLEAYGRLSEGPE